MAKKLSPSALHEALKNLSGWEEGAEGKTITKTYTFDTFVDAFAFMTSVAFFAEKESHHPEWTNIYNKVHVTLLTHGSGGVSAKDISLALHMDTVAFAFLNPCMSDQSGLIF